MSTAFRTDEAPGLFPPVLMRISSYRFRSAEDDSRRGRDVGRKAGMGSNSSARCHATVSAPLWTIGWLFTVGWLELTFWKGVLAILIWPYYIGAALAVRAGG